MLSVSAYDKLAPNGITFALELCILYSLIPEFLAQFDAYIFMLAFLAAFNILTLLLHL